MSVYQPPIPGLEPPRPPSGSLVDAVRSSIASRRELGALMPWHETLCAIMIELAEQVQLAKGIAKAQLYAQLLAAEAKLPEPVVQETADVVSFEADRIRAFLDEYAPGSDASALGDSAAVSHGAESAQMV